MARELEEMKFANLERRISQMEEKIYTLEQNLQDQNSNDIRLEEKLKGLQSDVLNIKKDVIDTLNEHSQRTWGLINTGIKIMCLLVGIICLMAGVKLLPDVMKFIGGM